MVACGGDPDNGVEGEEDSQRVKEIISQSPSLLNEDLNGYGYTPLATACYANCISIVEFLLSCDGIEVNKQYKV
jgi:hypothetical protein